MSCAKYVPVIRVGWLLHILGFVHHPHITEVVGTVNCGGTAGDDNQTVIKEKQSALVALALCKRHGSNNLPPGVCDVFGFSLS